MGTSLHASIVNWSPRKHQDPNASKLLGPEKPSVTVTWMAPRFGLDQIGPNSGDLESEFLMRPQMEGNPLLKPTTTPSPLESVDPSPFVGEVTLSFLNTTVGPAFLRGLIETPCEPQDFDVLVSIWWPCPMIC